jgi:hypothetical protein
MVVIIMDHHPIPLDLYSNIITLWVVVFPMVNNLKQIMELIKAKWWISSIEQTRRNQVQLHLKIESGLNHQSTLKVNNKTVNLGQIPKAKITMLLKNNKRIWYHQI